MSNTVREVFIISDLHLGGPDGFQMMRHPASLATFIKELARQTRPAKELVIAGDFVDFLAEGADIDGELPDKWEPLIEDPSVASGRLQRIAQESRFSVVFEALATFISARHRLTIMLGNHDIELSYPRVRRMLERVLGAEEGAGFRFIYDGEAYRIGDALVEHGNRYDRWNQVNYDSLRRVRSLQSRGQEVSRTGILQPPPGSRLVADVMNPIKRDYPFVDLLKPEDNAVLPILLALEPGYRKKIVAAIRALAPGTRGGVASDGIPVRLADASGAGAASLVQMNADVASEDPLERELARTFDGSESAKRFLSALDGGPRLQDASAMSLAGSLIRILLAGSSVEARLHPLLRALQALQNDRSFDVNHEPSDSPYLRAAEQITASGEFRYVIFGHTHHARRITLKSGARYFNSGTWADLMRVPPAIVAGGDAALEELRDFLKALRQDRLDSYRHFAPTYVRLELGADGCVCDADLAEAPV